MDQGGPAEGIVLLSHGDGGLLTHELLNELFLPAFSNQILHAMGDAAVIPLAGQRFAFSTDSFVVSPPSFPGGDIGRLAVCGTVNDLVVSGARPVYLTASFILPEGLAFKTLATFVRSMADAARLTGVALVAGDTKVIAGYSPQDIFINTTGVGAVQPGYDLGPERVRPSDEVIVTGCVGDHGASVLAARLGMDPAQSPVSDCAPLSFLLEALDPFKRQIRVMRDPTRGGLATCLKELAMKAGADIWLNEKSLPLSHRVVAIANVLGVDPLYLACEGRAVIIADESAAGAILEALKGCPLGEGASIIGTVKEGTGNVYLRTRLGGTRPLGMLTGSPLPRIC